MKSPFAYQPRPRPLQLASPGAAVAYLGAIVAVAFLYSNPLVLIAAGAAAVAAGLLAGAQRAVRVALKMGVALALLIVVVNALVVSRGETVLARLGDWPLFGQVNVTLEAIVAGASGGLRAAVTMIAAAVYSACVDPDRVLRVLRPLAGRSALTATLVSRLVPVAAADAGRLRDAARLRGPGAAEVGRAPLARRLLAGSLDRAVDVAATLELRGYSLGAAGETPARAWRRRTLRGAASSVGQIALLFGLPASLPRLVRRSPDRTRGFPQPPLGAPRPRNRRARSRYDRRFYAVAAAVLAVAIAGKALGADDFQTYPSIEIGLGPATLFVAVVVALSGLAPGRVSSSSRIPRGTRQTPASAEVARV